jgi:AcrR family transcriptional regulator
MARPATPILSRRRIAAAALELIDQGGIQGLTMRRLAERLGVQNPSLYNHVASRDDLLDEVTAIINEQIDVDALQEPDWRAGLAAFARSYRRAFSRHPDVVATIMRRPVNTDIALRAYDRIFERLLGAGWDPPVAGSIVAAVDYLVLGSAIETFAAGFDRPPEAYAPDYPHLARALGGSDRDSLDDQGFELGLQALLDSLQPPR